MRTPPLLILFAWIGEAFTAPEQYSLDSAAAIKVSDDIVAEITMLGHLT